MGICAIVGLAVLGLAQQDEAKTVTLTARGIPAGEVIREVCAQTGLPLRVGNVSSDPVILKVDAMPAKAFLESLASALGAGWRKDGDSLILGRESSDIFAADTEYDAARKKNWQRGQDQARANFRVNNDWSNAAIAKRMDQARAQAKAALAAQKQEGEGLPMVYVGSSGLPDNILIEEALNKLPVTAFMNLKAGERIVYSTQPNAIQVKLPYQPEAVATYLDARGRYLAACKTLAKDHRVTWVSNVGNESVPIGPTKLVVRISGQGESYANIECFLATSAGQVLASASATVSPSNTFIPIRPGSPDKVVISPESLAVAKVLSTGNTHPTTREFDVAYPSSPWLFDKQSAAVASIFSDPVAHEPVSYAPSELLIGWATAVKKNLIAYVSDGAVLRINRACLSPNARYDGVLAYPSGLGCSVSIGDSILVKPLDMRRAVESRCDRQSLRRLIDKVHTVGYLRLADLLAYRVSRGPVGNQAYEDLDYRWLCAIGPQIANQLNSVDDRTLRICSALGWNLEKLKDGQVQMGSAAMPKEIWAEMAAMARQGRIYLYAQDATELQRIEPTEMFATLMASNVTLSGMVSSMDVAYAIDANNVGRFLHAYQIGARKNMTMPQGYDLPRKFETYSLGKVRYLSISVTADSPSPASSKPANQSNYTRYGGITLGQLFDLTSTSNDKLTFDQLPEAFQTQVKSSAKMQGQITYYGGPGYRPIIPP